MTQNVIKTNYVKLFFFKKNLDKLDLKNIYRDTYKLSMLTIKFKIQNSNSCLYESNPYK